MRYIELYCIEWIKWVISYFPLTSTIITWNLIRFNCLYIWRPSGEDGRSRAEQLLHILRQIDPYVSSPVECQRRRGCLAVHEMLVKFRMVCISGYCALGCHGICTHNRQMDRNLQGICPKLPCKVCSSISFQMLLLSSFLPFCSHFYSSSPLLFFFSQIDSGVYVTKSGSLVFRRKGYYLSSTLCRLKFWS